MLEVISPYQFSEQRAEYDAGVARMRHSLYMDYPRHVHLETQARCNASCNFCPYPDLNRKHTKMSDELIDKILNELTAIPQEMNLQISPFKVSEPFLDVRLFDVLEKINTLLPQAKIALTSNSTPITEDKLEKLQDVKNLQYLWIVTDLELESGNDFITFDRQIDKTVVAFGERNFGENRFCLLSRNNGGGQDSKNKHVTENHQFTI